MQGTTPGTPVRHRAGYVALIGRPNVGKSTLLNRLVGTPLSIVSPKPQTTRHRITGILTRRDAQIVIVDTPGFHEPRHLLGRHMMRLVHAALKEVDVILMMLDATDGFTTTDRVIVTAIQRARKPSLLAINKIDRIHKPRLLPLMAACSSAFPWTALVPISAATGENAEPLLMELIRHLPIGPPLFPSDQLSEQHDRLFVAEMIRAQVLRYIHQEVPHAVTVVIERMSDEPSLDRVHIDATIVVERDSQKGILIGRHGQQLKRIGTAARHAIEHWLQRRAHVQLWVRVRKEWRRDPRLLSEMGYRF